jgi:hypothetical protein
MSWKDFRQITEQLTDALDRTPRDEASILAALDTLCATGDARVLVPLVAVLWPCFERQSARTILGKPYVKFRLTDLQISPGLRDEAAMRLVKFLAHFPVYRLRYARPAHCYAC